MESETPQFDNGLEVNWLEVSSQRSATGNKFSAGVIDFNFSIGSSFAFRPDKSYFRFGLKLTKGDGSTPVDLSDNVALCNDPVSALFDNVYFRAAGSDVSSIVNFSSQAGILKRRMNESGAWLNSVGKSAYGLDSSYTSRLNDTASDGSGLKKNEKYIHWVPPIGIMDSGALFSGDYRFQLNPSAQYKKRAVESTVDRTPGTHYDLEVTDIRLFICVERQNSSPTGIRKLYLDEIQIQSKQLSAGSAQSTLDFSVPPSTKKLCVWVAGSDSGADSRVPITKFKTKNQSDENLNSLQITYGNVSKPATNHSSEYAGAVNFITQRYLDTQIQTDLIHSDGGTASLSEWLENGGLYVFSFERSAMDRSTHVQLSIKFANMEANANVYVASIYSRVAEITTTNGYISSVQTLSV